MNQDEKDPKPPEPVFNNAQNFLARYRLQIAGFVGWFLAASILAPGSFGLIIFPGTIIFLIVFARSKETKGVAGGILAAVGLNFFLSLIRGVSLNAFCFIPFYYF